MSRRENLFLEVSIKFHQPRSLHAERSRAGQWAEQPSRRRREGDGQLARGRPPGGLAWIFKLGAGVGVGGDKHLGQKHTQARLQEGTRPAAVIFTLSPLLMVSAPKYPLSEGRALGSSGCEWSWGTLGVKASKFGYLFPIGQFCVEGGLAMGRWASHLTSVSLIFLIWEMG